MNVYRWKFEITDHTKAICYTEGNILHEIVINDQPVSLEEAKDQSISLIKMTAYKDVEQINRFINLNQHHFC